MLSGLLQRWRTRQTRTRTSHNAALFAEMVHWRPPGSTVDLTDGHLSRYNAILNESRYPSLYITELQDLCPYTMGSVIDVDRPVDPDVAASLMGDEDETTTE